MATVIINLASALPWIGNDLKELVWGAYSVSSPTITRFFTLHYTLAFILAAFAAVHLIALHDSGSGNPLGLTSNTDRLPMHPYFTLKDCVTIAALFLITAILIAFMPNALGHSDNYIKANPMSTPLSIVPEWYLLPFYAILRSIPNKLLGVIGMLGALLILMLMPIVDLGRFRGSEHRPLTRFSLLTFAGSFGILLVLGAHHVENPFILLGQIVSAYYFGFFLILLPIVSVIENTLVSLNQSYLFSVFE